MLGPNGSGPIVAKLEYVSWIEKIFELNFEAKNIVGGFFFLGESKLYQK